MNQKNKENIDEIRNRMFAYEAGNPKRIQHFMKVHTFSKMIAESLDLDEHEQYIIELASLLHDIGIKKCKELYDSSAGYLQEIEGPTIAGELLEEVGIEEDVIDRVCFLISKHHTYKDIIGIDWQILIEADFLVNALEEAYSIESIHSFGEQYFKTEYGKKLLKQLYG